ncbi:TIGR03915 family putative DNA repair protein [Olivibacter ginsenosidimutans]|uniref:TIGR03915 family putative DNA repair protein n=1 Tax=Olivibacter ginsenosidimutans TaxID=1176537 RepID=A0ABP9BH95_9SPHI
MYRLCYDGTWKGMLTLIFESFEYKWHIAAIYKKPESIQNGLFDAMHEVITNETKALRVWNALRLKLPPNALGDLYKVFLSEITQIEMTLCTAISFYFSGVDKPHLAYGRSDVLRIKQIAKMVDRERHRMKAFIRFSRQQDDLYGAMIEPDFNVLPLIRKHFSDRYADQRWLIYDVKRDYGIYYNLQEVEEVRVAFSKDFQEHKMLLEHPEEKRYRNLWQQYFKQVNIVERKNLKLHIQHVPRRYWKHLTEKQIL